MSSSGSVTRDRGSSSRACACLAAVAVLFPIAMAPLDVSAGPWPRDLEAGYFFYPTVGANSSIAVGDFNQDGLLDVYHATSTEGRYLLGKGDGTFHDDFNPPSGVGSPSGPFAFSSTRGLTSGDFNGDGRTDVAGFGPFGDIRVYSWPSTIPFLGAMNPGDGRMIEAADIDRDGWTDIVYATSTGSVFWARNAGGLYFISVNLITQNTDPGALAGLHVADLESDGDLDVCVVKGSTITTAWASSPGTFPVLDHVALVGTVPPGASSLGEWSGDTAIDLAYYEHTTGSIVFEGGGFGFGTPADGMLHTFVLEYGTAPMVAGDFDGVPGADFCQVGDGQVYVWRAVGGAIQATGHPASLYPTDVRAADMNRDGVLDIVSSDTQGITVALGNGDASFGGARWLGDLSTLQSGANYVAVDDLDLDGDSDVVLVGGGSAEVFLASSSTPWSLGTPSLGPFPTGADGGGGKIFTARINSDSYPDLVAMMNDAVYVYLGTGTGAFLSSPGFITYASTLAAAVGDVDGDGKRDLVIGDGGLVYVFRGDGAGAFTVGTAFSTPALVGFSSIAVGQIDGSGGEEIVVGGGNAALAIIWNYANVETHALAGVWNVLDVALGNLDASQPPDIAVLAGTTSGKLLVASTAGFGSPLTEWYREDIPVASRKLLVGSLRGPGDPHQVLIPGQYTGDLYVAYPALNLPPLVVPRIGLGFDVLDIAMDRVGVCDGVAVALYQNPGSPRVAFHLRTLSSTVDMNAPPLIESPPIAAVEAGSILTMPAKVRDFEGDPVLDFGADLSGLPAGNSASFAVVDSSGTLTWAVPEVAPPGGADPVGVWPVTLHANSLSRTRTTLIDVLPPGITSMATFTWQTTVLDPGTYNVQFAAQQGATTVTTTVVITVEPPGAPLVARPGPSRAASSGAEAVTAAEISLYAPASVLVTAGQPVAFTVSAVGATALTVDLSTLPAASAASFVVDREPKVTAPNSVVVTPGVPASIVVTAQDQDNDPISALDAITTALPPGSTASFAPGASNTSGTLTVTLPIGASGKYGVMFRARNALVGRTGTVLQVSGLSSLPRGYWKFNGNTFDERGTAHLTYSGAYGTGVLGEALAPTGAGASLEPNPLVSFGLGPTPFSVEAWVRVPGPVSSAVDFLVGTDWGANRWAMSIGADGTAVFSAQSGTLPFMQVSSLSRVDDGNMHHVAITYADPNLRVYVDTVEEAATSVASLAVPGASSYFYVGGVPMMGSFSGAIDELRVWDVTLEPEDIASLFDQELSDLITAAEPAPPVRYANRLGANRPNPFNPTTTIPYELERAGPVQLRIFDIQGRLVRTLRNGPAEAGPARAVWRGDDEAGNAVASGVYLAVLETQGFRASRRLVLLK